MWTTMNISNTLGDLVRQVTLRAQGVNNAQYNNLILIKELSQNCHIWYFKMAMRIRVEHFHRQHFLLLLLLLVELFFLLLVIY